MINEQNYYAVNNRGLSQSKIKMYEIDPNYMYRACISGELKREDKESFKVGREVDSILTEIDKAQNTVIAPYDDFRSKEAREWKAEQEAMGKVVIKEDGYEKIMAISIAVQRTSVWREIEKEFTTQEILQVPDDSLGEHFDCLYGKPDAYRINEDGVCDLADLKTSLIVDQKKFFYKASDFGYFKQLYFYSKLLKIKYPQIKSFRFWFMVAENKEPYRVVLFRVPNSLVYEQKDNVEAAIASIASRTDWSRPDINWDSATVLSDPRGEDFDDYEFGDGQFDVNDMGPWVESSKD